jgi:hypothetical protein
MATSVIDSWVPGTPERSALDAEPMPGTVIPDSGATEAPFVEAAYVEAAAPPFQFRLRTLLGLVAAAGGLCAVLVNIGPLWSTLVLWTGLLVAAHVAGNACGTKRTTARPTRTRPLLGSVRLSLNLRATRLRQRNGPGPLMLVGVGVGALAGGVAGTVVLWAVYWDTFGLGPVGVGGASSAVVGGFLGFLSASFVEVAGRAWQEASGELPWRR